ncbi:hypothetical protein [Pseudaestuariivita rosea]|uniref:hypothetical protein n=1 Tax=Pseudaestuariivita rosea TaxID=2763263 RepID=UPI001ABA2DDE|nr:hypothetical protein [Pseudaestuariivita rosea]
MAFITDTFDRPRSSFLKNLWTGLIALRERSLNCEGRVDQIDALNAKSDQDLAKLGLTRDDIPRYVFRDHIYL